MALPTSGPLTLAQIQGEFGGSNPISLSEYYAGGGLVPPGTSGTYGAVPSSGTISIQNFYGTSNVDVSITNQFIVFNSIFPQDAYARYQLDSNGKVYEYTGTTPGTPNLYIEDWVEPNSEASNYECFASVSGAALQTGTTGSWLALTSDRMWGIAETGAATKFTDLTVTIREVGTTTNLTSATISLSVSTA